MIIHNINIIWSLSHRSTTYSFCFSPFQITVIVTKARTVYWQKSLTWQFFKPWNNDFFSYTHFADDAKCKYLHIQNVCICEGLWKSKQIIRKYCLLLLLNWTNKLCGGTIKKDNWVFRSQRLLDLVLMSLKFTNHYNTFDQNIRNIERLSKS